MSGAWTTERHEAVQRRCDAAAPGPWVVDDANFELIARLDDAECVGYEHYRYVAEVDPMGRETGVAQVTVDAQFIAEARADLPDALAEIERLQEKNAILKLLLERVQHDELLAALALGDALKEGV